MIRRLILSTVLCLLTGSPSSAQSTTGQTRDLNDRVTHGYATSEGGVKIHYATLGAGPLVVLIHGFPDFWYTWRHQMDALADRFQMVAIDQRGYNLSDKPKGVDNYAMRLLVADVAAIVHHLGRDKATIVGHDWGGEVAWNFAMGRPGMTENLVILNDPHPNGYERAVKAGKGLAASGEYWQAFVQKTASDPTVFFGQPMTPETLAHWVKEPAARPRYLEAFGRSDFDAMLNYYKMWVRETGVAAAAIDRPKIQSPVLVVHGLADTTVTSDMLSGTWDWVAHDLTLVTIPGAGHFVQQDAADLVTSTLRSWLTMRSAKP